MVELVGPGSLVDYGFCGGFTLGSLGSMSDKVIENGRKRKQKCERTIKSK